MTQYQIISNDPGGPTIIRQTVSPRSQALLTPRHRPPPVATTPPPSPAATYWSYPKRCVSSATAARATIGKDDAKRRTFPPPWQGLQLCVAGY